MSNVNSLQLLQRCEAGESDAIEEFVATYQPPVYKLALSILDDPAEADEATQDAILSALGHLSAFRGDSAFTTWLYSLTLNHCRMRLRNRRSRERLARLLQQSFHHQSMSRQIDAGIQQFETDDDLWSAVRNLSDRQREVIVLRYYHNLSILQIAKVIGISERTVHNRLHAAHERLRLVLNEKDAL